MKQTQKGHIKNATVLKMGVISFFCTKKTVFTEAVLMEKQKNYCHHRPWYKTLMVFMNGKTAINVKKR